MDLNKKIILRFALSLLISGILAFLIISNFKKNLPEKEAIQTEEKNIEVPEVIKQLQKENSLQDEIVLESNDNFQISYYSEDNAFIITLLNKDIEFSQLEAEKRFIEILEISKEEACKLDVHMGVPYFVNELYAGGIYKMSFCPDGGLLKN